MLTLESGVMGELVGSSMLVEVVNRLIDLDVSCLKLYCKLVGEKKVCACLS